MEVLTGNTVYNAEKYHIQILVPNLIISQHRILIKYDSLNIFNLDASTS